jgi:2-polyprenyl-6-methoxyphenol hydroxylase-like FAD-dependent oxidoreductase
VAVEIDTAVIVVGAGPTGLMLANELALAGVPTVVLEARERRSRLSRAGAVQPRTAEVLDLRGLLEPLAAREDRTGGHFGGLPVPLDCRPWDTRHPYPLSVPQARIEDLVERRVTDSGVRVLRGVEVTAADQDESGVTAVAGDVRARGRYLVACDGGHSAVRRLLGVPFPGRAGTLSAVLADVRLGRTGPLVPTGRAHFSALVRHGNGYWTMLSPDEDGGYRFVFGPLDRQGPPRDVPISDDEVGAALHAVYGAETELLDVREASRFGDASRQIEHYRVGRVLFAGDAAHIHPPLGGQGLNLGIQDAMNLGWKLAAEVNGWAPEGLLDTYHAERHPAAARVLHHIRAQRVLADRTPTEDVAALRDIVTDLARLPQGQHYLSGLIGGLDLRYPMPAAPDHPLLGQRMPDVDLHTDRGMVRFSTLMRDGRGLLLDRAGDGDPVDGWRGRVRYQRVAGGLPARAILVRPDGHVGWAADDSVDGLPAALSRWFGPAHRMTPLNTAETAG